MATYTYLACDLLTDRVLDELPLSGVTFDRQLNGWGQLKGKVTLGDDRWSSERLWAASIPARTALWVARDGQLVWGGIVWTRDKRTGDLSASEFLSYYQRRLIRASLVYTATDQLTIARALVADAAAVAGAAGDIGLTVGAEVSAVLRDRTYPAAERKPYAEALLQLATVDDGFDVRVDASGDLDSRAKVLALGYPRLGRVDSGLVFELPGNLADYGWPQDGSEATTLADAMGAGDGNRQLVGTASYPALEALGYPRLERAESYSDVAVQATLNAHARADLAATAGLVVNPKLVVRASADPVLGTYDPGDYALVNVTDASFPRPAAGGPGLAEWLRILSISCTPGGAGADERVELTMAGVHVK